jgi:hypothetical protein
MHLVAGIELVNESRMSLSCGYTWEAVAWPDEQVTSSSTHYYYLGANTKCMLP